jgi:hypothetical protein
MIHRTKTIRNLTTGDVVASAGFTGNGDAGAWIRETVAELCECDPDAVSVVEDDERGDLLAVDGIPVYSLN